LKLLSVGIKKMIFARAHHQIGAGLRELYYFNAVVPTNIGITPVDSSNRVTDYPASVLRNRRRLDVGFIDVLRL